MAYNTNTPEGLENARRQRREWYKRNKKHAISKVKSRQADIYKWFCEYKSTLSCEQCPQNHVAALTFHHINPQDKDIDLCRAAHDGWSKERIMTEVKKCKVLCFNCHAILHWKERQI